MGIRIGRSEYAGKTVTTDRLNKMFQAPIPMVAVSSLGEDLRPCSLSPTREVFSHHRSICLLHCYVPASVPMRAAWSVIGGGAMVVGGKCWVGAMWRGWRCIGDEQIVVRGSPILLKIRLHC